MGDACAECGTSEGKLRLCTRCRSVRYCSTECQRKGWSSGHKDVCASSSAVVPKPSVEISLETRKNLLELQTKIVDIQNSLKATEAQMVAVQKQYGSAKVTEKVIGDLPEATRTFKSVGRMYLLQERSDIRDQLGATMDSAETKMKKLQDSKDYLLRNMAEAEESMLELKSRG